jgi:hypothetical protein
MIKGEKILNDFKKEKIIELFMTLLTSIIIVFSILFIEILFTKINLKNSSIKNIYMNLDLVKLKIRLKKKFSQIIFTKCMVIR